MEEEEEEEEEEEHLPNFKFQAPIPLWEAEAFHDGFILIRSRKAREVYIKAGVSEAGAVRALDLKRR